MEKMVQKLGDGQLICSDCWSKEFEQNEPTYGWEAGVCDFCISQAAATLGRKGGQAKSEAKRTASRENGKKGGRPKGSKDKGEKQ